ncbi:MAG: hypothetical protein FJ267_03540, partial [Planctomycetes bacterium]|nr:hypothetical protein [Planctomycetota bacterium]
MNSIKERLKRLEEAVFGGSPEPGKDEWQKTVGMFRGDQVMQEILVDIKESRKRERENARN